jgi:translation initiation factor 2 beta subunit (eIF-2beta)/eIF-5
MSDLVNMNGKDDPFYRYVVKRIKVKQEISKTILVNNDIVSKQTGRPDDWILTYIGQSLGVSTNIDKKNQNKCSLTGKHDEKILQEKYFDFVKKYVLCGKCGNPETTPTITGKKKNQSIELSCRSCGNVTQLDGDDKFVKFMVLHPMKIENESKKINITEISNYNKNEDINNIIKSVDCNINLTSTLVDALEGSSTLVDALEGSSTLVDALKETSQENNVSDESDIDLDDI